MIKRIIPLCIILSFFPAAMPAWSQPGSPWTTPSTSLLTPVAPTTSKLNGESAMMSEDIVSRYAWLDTSRYLGMCITYVRGRDEDALIQRFGGDPATARPLSLSDVATIGMLQERRRMMRLSGEDPATARPMSTQRLLRQSRRESRNIDKTWMEEYLPLRACPIVLTDLIGEWVVILED